MEPSWDLTSLTKACVFSFHVSYVVKVASCRLQLLISLQLLAAMALFCSLLYSQTLNSAWTGKMLRKCLLGAWMHK